MPAFEITLTDLQYAGLAKAQQIADLSSEIPFLSPEAYAQFVMSGATDSYVQNLGVIEAPTVEALKMELAVKDARIAQLEKEKAESGGGDIGAEGLIG